MSKLTFIDLFTIWMAEQVYNLIKEENNASETLKVADDNINSN